MGFKGKFLRIGATLAAVLLLSGLLSGCAYYTQYRQLVRPLSLAFDATYSGGQTDLVVYYSIPPPKPGKVYVMWAYSLGRKDVAKLAAIRPGIELVVRGTVPFPATGVIITQEDSPDVTQMVGTGLIELNLWDPNVGTTAGNSNSSP